MNALQTYLGAGANATFDGHYVWVEGPGAAERVALNRGAFGKLAAFAVESWPAPAPDTIPGGVRVEATSPTVTPGSHVIATLPSGWWIATNAEHEPCVWEPQPAEPRLVISQSLAGHALWRVLARALPDRGSCEHCTAQLCEDHGGERSA